MALKITPADVVNAVEPVTDTADAPNPVEAYIDRLRTLIERWQGGLALTQADKDFLTAPPLYVAAPYDLVCAIGEYWDMRITDVAARLIVSDAARNKPRPALSTIALSVEAQTHFLQNLISKHCKGKLLDEVEKIQLGSMAFPASAAPQDVCDRINNGNPCTCRGIADVLLGRDAALLRRCQEALHRVRAATAKGAWVDSLDIELLRTCGSEIGAEATNAAEKYACARDAVTAERPIDIPYRQG